MESIRVYLPLAGFVLGTTVIGFGFVIPHSSIAGFNGLTLGFASTIVGAALTYVAGIQLAQRPACPRSLPLSVRVNRWINGQAAHPRGVFGWFLGLIWRRDHREINRATLDLLDIKPNDNVLEIGFGPGEALHEASRKSRSVLGLDVSSTMLSIARQRNRRAINQGHLTIRKIEDSELGLESYSIDRAFCVHAIYFWKYPDATLAQIAEALRPGGRLVLAMRPEAESIPTRFRDPSYRFYTGAIVHAMLEKAGFVDVHTVNHPEISNDVVWVIGDKRT